VAGNLLCSPSTLCRHIGLLFGERLDTLSTSSDKKISGFTPSTRQSIRCGLIFFHSGPVHTLSDSLRIYFFSTLESGFIFFWIRCRIRRLRVDGSRTRKEKVADSKISGYVWRGLIFVLVARSRKKRIILLRITRKVWGELKLQN